MLKILRVVKSEELLNGTECDIVRIAIYDADRFPNTLNPKPHGVYTLYRGQGINHRKVEITSEASLNCEDLIYKHAPKVFDLCKKVYEVWEMYRNKDADILPAINTLLRGMPL